MRNYRYVFVLLISLSTPACAEDGKVPPESKGAAATAGASLASESTEDSSQNLPVQWESLTHSEWLGALRIASCDAKNQGSESRRKNWVRLDENTQLLLLTCAQGAYQDAFHVYAVNTGLKTITPVILKSAQKEDANDGELVWGSLYKSDQENTVELLHLSAATGACGWRALYPIEAVKRGGSIVPEAVFGDDDCYNGVTVDEWPAIERTLP